ncbi:SDR family NAD(P)-dependent oxidoreductase [Prevotella sp. Rep29]|uniref:SDR family NAD(P)-dependent oxidoreductase n=1 Tax=Prevotella sp. Rep29 TaxID=2691580 RepID=UPI001C6E2E67|nr:SDR family oxidoreductase [Prevotella sp. Rep29]QYR10299.1 SDR family oxidoreductase [Prevotella sp. Rep29]
MTDLLQVKNRRYLVTGAASGIGRATALLLSDLGAKVLLADINAEKLEEVREECKGEGDTLIIDLMKTETIKQAIKDKVSSFGKLHGFVHCAGIPYIAPLKVVSAEKVEKVYKLNTYAAIELAKVCSNKQIYTGEHGSFVLISSVYGLVGSAANVGYAMSKGAIVAITKSLAMELVNNSIRVNCVAPGFIKTPMADKVDGMMDSEYDVRLNLLHPMGLGRTEDVAKGILFLLSDMSSWMTGAVLNVDGGFTAQ